MATIRQALSGRVMEGALLWTQEGGEDGLWRGVPADPEGAAEEAKELAQAGALRVAWGSVPVVEQGRDRGRHALLRDMALLLPGAPAATMGKPAVLLLNAERATDGRKATLEAAGCAQCDRWDAPEKLWVSRRSHWGGGYCTVDHAGPLQDEALESASWCAAMQEAQRRSPSWVCEKALGEYVATARLLAMGAWEPAHDLADDAVPRLQAGGEADMQLKFAPTARSEREGRLAEELFRAWEAAVTGKGVALSGLSLSLLAQEGSLPRLVAEASGAAAASRSLAAGVPLADVLSAI